VRIGIDALLMSNHDAGVGGYVRSLLCALAHFEKDNEYVVYMRPGVVAPGDLPGDRFKIQRIRSARLRATRIAWQRFGLPRRFQRDGLDALHCPSYVAPLRRRGPTVLTLHDVIALSHPALCRRLNAVHYRTILPKVVRSVDRIVASSEATRNRILSLLDVPEEKVRVIHPGVDKRYFRTMSKRLISRVRRTYKLPVQIVLTVGNIEPKKNLIMLLRAFDKLKQSSVFQHVLVFVGRKNWGYAQVMRLARKIEARDDIRFLGWVPADDLAALYAMADAVVFVPVVEGFGLPVVEAMASGAPVIVSEGVPYEVYEDAALSVAPDSVDAIAAGLASVLTDRDLSGRLVAAGRRQAARFRWEHTVRAMCMVYAEVVGAPGD